MWETLMARPLRIDRAGMWYHLTSRGNEGGTIFREDADYLHFLGQLAEGVARFQFRLHGYVLMPNHYHLLVETTEANLSRSMQWLNSSYSQWFNRRHRRQGHLLQGRFKAILVEAQTWGLEASRYIHLNPVRIKRLALGKANRRRLRQRVGKELDQRTIQNRLTTLTQYRWSSYRAYVGRERPPEWLTLEPVLGFLGKRRQVSQRAYRQFVEQGVLEGASLDLYRAVKGQTLLGETAFVEQAQKWLKGNEREQPALRALGWRPSWEKIVAAVESERGEQWETFVDRRGDAGRDMALWLARKLGGLSLQQLAGKVGGISYPGVSTALRQMARRLVQEKGLARQVGRIEKKFIHNNQI